MKPSNMKAAKSAPRYQLFLSLRLRILKTAILNLNISQLMKNSTNANCG